MVIRIMMMVCLAAMVAGAVVAAPSARLEALAGDGLLLEDIGAYHLWPASVASAEYFSAFRLDVDHRLENTNELAVQMLQSLGEQTSFHTRLNRADPTTIDSSRFILQVARKLGDFAAGVGFVEDTEDWHDQTTAPRSGWQGGLLWTPTDRMYLECAYEWTFFKHHPYWDHDLYDVRWRGRISYLLYETVVVSLTHDDHEMDSTVLGEPYEGALEYRSNEISVQVMPDSDSMLVLAFYHRDQVSVADHYYHPSMTRSWINEQCVRLGVEVRPSAWVTLRSGMAYALTKRYWNPTPLHSVALSAGASIHLGDVDVVMAWSDSGGRYGRFLPGGGPSPVLKLDVVLFN